MQVTVNQDNDPPTVTKALASCDRLTVTITFSEKMDTNTSPVLAGIYEGVQELMTQVALQAPLALSDFVSALPKQYLARMQTHGVSQEGQQYWVDLCSSLDA